MKVGAATSGAARYPRPMIAMLSLPVCNTPARLVIGSAGAGSMLMPWPTSLLAAHACPAGIGNCALMLYNPFFSLAWALTVATRPRTPELHPAFPPAADTGCCLPPAPQLIGLGALLALTAVAPAAKADLVRATAAATAVVAQRFVCTSATLTCAT